MRFAPFFALGAWLPLQNGLMTTSFSISAFVSLYFTINVCEIGKNVFIGMEVNVKTSLVYGLWRGYFGDGQSPAKPAAGGV